MAMEKITNEKFNSLSWHDAVIDKIVIDRRNPGIKDEIRIFITWYNDTKSMLCFHNVYWADLNMNFGVMTPEYILTAESKGKEYEQIQELYKKLNERIINIDMNYYEIETNTTTSKIRIIAEALIILSAEDYKCEWH